MTDEELAAIRVAEIKDQMGWTDDDLLDMHAKFLVLHGLTGKFANFVENTQRAVQAQRVILAVVILPLLLASLLAATTPLERWIKEDNHVRK